MKDVAVLFARKNSIYKKLEGCEVYDIDRDARTFSGGMPVVAHPPCRAWGTLAHMAKPRHDEKDLAPWAVDQVRANGGVLEHPKRSKLWEHCSLPPADGITRDQWGGWSLLVPQMWWGHRAEKLTLLYIVGLSPRQLPPLPFVMGEPTHVIASSGRRSDGKRYGTKKECSKAERERTPVALAEWLVEVARRAS
jgi:hypothetical protein